MSLGCSLNQVIIEEELDSQQIENLLEMILGTDKRETNEMLDFFAKMMDL